MRSLRKLGTSALLMLLVIWCAFHFRSEWQQMSLSLNSHAAWAISLAAALAIVNYGLRALRWSLYLARLGHYPGLGFAASTYVAGFAFAISPGKLGELARARYYLERGIPFRELAAIALMERMMDVVALLALATLALSLLGGHAAVLGALAVVVACALVIVVISSRTNIRSRPARDGRMVRHFFSALESASGAVRTARFLLSAPCILMGLLIGIAAWGCEGVGLYVLSGLAADAGALRLPVAVGIYASATVAGAATFVPGGLGGTEAAMTALLATTGIPAPDALAITFVSRLTTLWQAVAIGWLTVLFLELRLRRTTACI